MLVPAKPLPQPPPQGEGALALILHFISLNPQSPPAMWTSARQLWRCEQSGDDGAADFRERRLRRSGLGLVLFSPGPPCAAAGAGGRRRQCSSSAHVDAARSTIAPGTRRARVPA